MVVTASGVLARPPGLVGVGDLDRTCRGLRDPNVVAEGISQCAVDPVRLLDRLFGELDPLCRQFLVGLAAVIGGEDCREPQRAFGEELADLGGTSSVNAGGPGTSRRMCRSGSDGKTMVSQRMKPMSTSSATSNPSLPT